jgi:hypothetical protein
MDRVQVRLRQQQKSQFRMERQRRRIPMTERSEGLCSFKKWPKRKLTYHIYILCFIGPMCDPWKNLLISSVIVKTSYAQKFISVSFDVMVNLQKDYIWQYEELPFIFWVLSLMKILVPL